MQKHKRKLTFLLFLFALALLLSVPFVGNSKNSFTTQTTAHAQMQVEKTLTYHGNAQANGVFSGRGVTVTLPGTIQAGDLLIAVAGTNGSASSWMPLDGWTQGTNSGSNGAQGLSWWWKVADGSEAGTPLTFQSSAYADGGVVVNVYHGQAADPIVGVSSLTTSDNYGNGHVSTAAVTSVSLATEVTAVPLLFASWQPNPSDISWPSGFIFESAASDGYASVGLAERLSALSGDSFPGYTLPLSSGQAVAQTLQVLVKVK